MKCLGCENHAMSESNYCSRCWDERYANPKAPPMQGTSEMSLLDTIAHDFWSHVDAGTSNDACWPWKGYTNGRGYGRYYAFGKMQTAHRISWALNNGGHLPPADLLVCHTCDNPICCNPSHLWIGTQKDNMRDAGRKGRLPGRDRNQHTGKTHCKHGHEFTPENTMTDEPGRRRCRICTLARYKRTNARRPKDAR